MSKYLLGSLYSHLLSGTIFNWIPLSNRAELAVLKNLLISVPHSHLPIMHLHVQAVQSKRTAALCIYSACYICELISASFTQWYKSLWYYRTKKKKHPSRLILQGWKRTERNVLEWRWRLLVQGVIWPGSPIRNTFQRKWEKPALSDNFFLPSKTLISGAICNVLPH